MSVEALEGWEFAPELVQRYAPQLDDEMPTLINLFVEQVDALGA